MVPLPARYNDARIIICQRMLLLMHLLNLVN